MELQKIWKIILRRKWIIILVFLAVSLTSIIGSFLMIPVYESKAKIIIGGASESIESLKSKIGIGQASQVSTDPSDKEIDTKKGLVISNQIIKELAEKLQLRDKHGNLYTADGLLNKKLFPLFPQPYIEVDQYEESNMLEITASSADPQQAQFIISTLSELYLDKNLHWIREEYDNADNFLDSQIKNVRSDYLDTLKSVESYKIKENTMDLKAETTFLFQRVEDLAKDLRESTIKRYAHEASIKEIINQLNKIDMFQASSKEYKDNPQLTQLREDLNNLLIDLEGAKQDYTESHPKVVVIKNKIDKIKALLTSEVEKTFSKEVQSLNPGFNSLQKELAERYIDLEEAKAKEKVIPGYISEYERRLAGLPKKESEQTKLLADVDAVSSLYKSLLNYKHDVGVAKAMTMANVRLIELPEKPEFPFSPNKKLNAAIGIFLGFTFGLSLAFIVEYLDDTIKEADDLTAYNFTLLGLIPEFAGRSHLITTTDSNDPLYEAYRSVVASCQFVRAGVQFKRLLITSIGPKEGKSTTTANMGILYAMEGKKTILIDADLRRARLHSLFGLSNTRGLIDLLTRDIDIESVINNTGINNLSVITSGSVPLDTGQLLKSPRLREMMDRLSALYDVILIDAAPLYIKNDAIALKEYTDDMLIVARNNVTPHKAISRVNGILQNAKISILGVVLNKG